MSGYIEKGYPCGIFSYIITMITCVVYGYNTYGFFIGVPVGFVVGTFFGLFSAIIAAFIWPLIYLAIICLLILVAQNKEVFFEQNTDFYEIPPTKEELQSEH